MEKVGHDEVGPNISIEDVIRIAAGLPLRTNDIPGSNQPSSTAIPQAPAGLPIPLSQGSDSKASMTTKRRREA